MTLLAAAQVSKAEEGSDRAGESSGSSQKTLGAPTSALGLRWKNHREKVMFLVIGGFNTLFAYGCFSLLYYLLHEYVPPSVVVITSYVVQSVVGFLTMRYLVFQPVSHLLLEYLRHQVVYVPLLIVNMVALPLALKHTGLNAYVIQALLVVPAVVVGYLGSKYFTFRKWRAKGVKQGTRAE